MLHPITWLAWTIATAMAATLTRNPLYLSLILGVVAVIHVTVSQNRPDAAGWQAIVRLTLGLSLFTIPVNALNVHTGSTILFQLPANWPIVGGNITLEAVLWGACGALGLTTLMLIFATLNLTISQSQLLRLTPAFLYEAGLIISIALTFFPQMIASAKEIREAQLIRGHRMRRIRDMLPFVMALLTTGLERSFQLAESMEARGFGGAHAPSRARDLLHKTLTLLGLGGVLGGVFTLTYFETLRALGWGGLIASVALLLAVFWAQGRRVKRTHYRRARYTWRDGLIIAASAVAAAALVWSRVTAPHILAYYPYTAILPPFRPWMGAALMTLVAPALIKAPS